MHPQERERCKAVGTGALDLSGGLIDWSSAQKVGARAESHGSRRVRGGVRHACSLPSRRLWRWSWPVRNPVASPSPAQPSPPVSPRPGCLCPCAPLAQELGDALGKAVAVKVDVEVRREREAMEERLAKMATSLEAERAAMLTSMRDGGGASEAALARKEAEFAALQQRAHKLEALQQGLDAHVDAFRAELERVQQVLSTLMPSIHEANVIADAMGRKVRPARRADRGCVSAAQPCASRQPPRAPALTRSSLPRPRPSRLVRPPARRCSARTLTRSRCHGHGHCHCVTVSLSARASLRPPVLCAAHSARRSFKSSRAC